MTMFTVIGLRDSGSGELLIAGVVEGDRPTVDDDQNGTAGFERWCAVVEADNWRDAEHAAVVEDGAEWVCADELEDGDVLRYEDGAEAEIERVERDEEDGDVIVRFPNGDEAVFDESAQVRVVA